jgi:hypothetical protein
MLNTLIKIANYLDSIAHYSLANAVDITVIAILDDVSPPFDLEEARLIADAIGIDFSIAKFSLHDFRRGLAVELEHGSHDQETDVIHHNYLDAGRIAWAHLKEDGQYYNKLDKLGL